MKPMNFPERKRQRQLGALERLAANTKKGDSNAAIKAVLEERTKTDARNVRTKKKRG